MTMTPEKIAELKKLQSEYKEYREGLKDQKTELFENILEKFATSFDSVKKDLITVSTGEAYEDGNVWAISFGTGEGESEEGSEKKIAVALMSDFLAKIESVIGIGSSIKLTGQYKGNDCYLMIRKR